MDDGTHEGLKVLVRAANGNLVNASLEAGHELSSARLGDVNSGGGRALLALVLEGTTDGVVDGAGDIGGRV